MADQWGKGVVLCVTGLSRQERQVAEDLITAAGGRYTPNLSWRCTHLLVARHAAASDKVASALRNREKWGLKLVAHEWLAACAKRGALQSEASYPALDERTPLAARPASVDNKVAPASATGGSRITTVPDSCGQLLSAQQQQRHQNSVRQSVISLPSRGLVREQAHSDFLTQLPEVKHSAGGTLQQQGSAAAAGTDTAAVTDALASLGGGCSSVSMRQASVPASRCGTKGVTWAQLPTAAAEQYQAIPVGDDCDVDDEPEGWRMEDHLPLTQAGFMPTEHLLEQLMGRDRGDAYSPLPHRAAPARGSASPEDRRGGDLGGLGLTAPPAAARGAAGTATVVAAAVAAEPGAAECLGASRQHDRGGSRGAGVPSPAERLAEGQQRPLGSGGGGLAAARGPSTRAHLSGEQAVVSSWQQPGMPSSAGAAPARAVGRGAEAVAASAPPNLGGNGASSAQWSAAQPRQPPVVQLGGLGASPALASPPPPADVSDLLSRLQQVPHLATFTPLASRNSSGGHLLQGHSQQQQQQQQRRGLLGVEHEVSNGTVASGPLTSQPSPAVPLAATCLGASAELAQQLRALHVQPAVEQQLLAGGEGGSGCPLATGRALDASTRAGSAAPFRLGSASSQLPEPARFGAVQQGPQTAQPTGLEQLMQQLQQQLQQLQQAAQRQQGDGAPGAEPPAPAPHGTTAILEQLQALQQGGSMDSRHARAASPSGGASSAAAALGTAALLQQLQNAAAMSGERHARAEVPGAPPEGLDTATLLQQLQAATPPAPPTGPQPQYQRQRQQELRPEGSWSPMQVSPAPPLRSNMAAALERRLHAASFSPGPEQQRHSWCHQGQGQQQQQQQAVAAPAPFLGSPMQVVPAPAPRDTLARLQQLHTSSSQRQPPAGHDTAALLAQLSAGEQQQQQQQSPRAPPVDATALMQQLQHQRQEPWAAEGSGTGSAGACALATHDLLRQLQAAAVQQQQQHVARPQPLDAATLLQQLRPQHPQPRGPNPASSPLKPAGAVGPTQPPSSELLQHLMALSSHGHCFTPLRGAGAAGAAGAGTHAVAKAKAAASEAGIARATSRPSTQQPAAAGVMGPRGGESGLRELERGLAGAILAAEEREQQAAGHNPTLPSPTIPAPPTMRGLPAQAGLPFGEHDGGAAAQLENSPACASLLPAASVSPIVSETVMATPSPPPASSTRSALQQQQEQVGQGLPTPTQLLWEQAPHVSGSAQQAQAGLEARPAPTLKLLAGQEAGPTSLAAAPNLGGGPAEHSGQLPEPTLVVVPEPQSVPAGAGQGGRAEGQQDRQAATPGPAQNMQQQQQLLEPPGSGSVRGGGGGRSEVGSVARAGDAVSQVADSEHGLFDGMAAILDPDLPQEDAERVSQALVEGGGRVVEGARLGQGATHVVCQPEATLRWLSMGLGIVSPQWVLRSLKAGRQQRFLTVSADAMRHLPSGQGYGQRQGQGQGPPNMAESMLAGSSRGSMSPPSNLQTKEARQAMLQQLAAGHVTAAAAASGDREHDAPSSMDSSTTPPTLGCALTTPAALLLGVAWTVTDPPAAVAPDPTCQHQAAPWPRVYGPGEVVPDSEDEEEQFCFQATQAAYQEALGSLGFPGSSAEGSEGAAAAAGAAGGGSVGFAQRAQRGRPGRWLDVAGAFRGAPSLTLLLPRDSKGELGHDTRCFSLPGRSATAFELLQHIHEYYQEAIPPEEQVSLLGSSPAAHAVAALVKPAFLDLRPLARHQLLGPRLALEGLFKVTREPLGSIYDVRLGC